VKLQSKPGVAFWQVNASHRFFQFPVGNYEYCVRYHNLWCYWRGRSYSISQWQKNMHYFLAPCGRMLRRLRDGLMYWLSDVDSNPKSQMYRSIFLGRLKPFKKRFGEMQNVTEWPCTSRCCPQSVRARQIYLGMYRRHRRYLTSLFLGDDERRRPSAHPGFNRPIFAYEDGIPSVNSMGGSVNVEPYLMIAVSNMGCNGVGRP